MEQHFTREARMPAYQQMFGRVNQHFNIESIGATKDAIEEALADQEVPLSSIAQQLDVARTNGEVGELDKLPRGIAAALRAVLSDNFAREGGPWEVQFVWEPSYDYRVTVHEAGPSSISNGGISIVLGTRYPDDARAGAQ
jgi:hypothetical protein